MTKYMICSYEGNRVIKHIEGSLSIRNEVVIFFNSNLRLDSGIIAVFNTREVFIVEEY